jgi:hypothetical protein
LSEQDFKKSLREYLASGPANQELVETLEKLEMELASPGDWELAKHTPDPKPED